VLVDGAKISGILLETGQTKGRSWVIVGIGINLLSNPADTPYPATHFLEHISESELSGPEPIFTGPEAVLAVLSGLADRSFRGKLLGLGENGELQVEHDNGTIESIFAGDVYPNSANIGETHVTGD